MRALIKFPWEFFGVVVFTERALPCYTVVARLGFKPSSNCNHVELNS